MKITCPQCGASGNLSDKLIPDEGRNVKCPKCKHAFLITLPTTDLPPVVTTGPQPTVAFTQPPEIKQKVSRSRSSMLLIRRFLLITVLVFFGIGIIGFGGWYYYTHNERVIAKRFESMLVDLLNQAKERKEYQEFLKPEVTFDVLKGDEVYLDFLYGGSFGYRRHEFTCDITKGEYNIIKTDSIVSPYVAVYSFTTYESVSKFYRDKTAALSSMATLPKGTHIFELTFAYQENEWVFKDLKKVK